ncbi:ABC transporter permease, partial [Vibrio quintilis]
RGKATLGTGTPNLTGTDAPNITGTGTSNLAGTDTPNLTGTDASNPTRTDAPNLAGTDASNPGTDTPNLTGTDASNPINPKNIRGQSVNIVGTFFDQPIAVPDDPDYHTGNRLISTYWHVDGQWPDDSQATDGKVQALAGKTLAEKQHWSAGDTITLTGKNGARVQLIITGILTNGSADENAVIMPLHAGQQLLGLQGRVHTVKVSALTVPENALSKKAREDLESLDSDEYDLWFCTAYVSSISFQLEGAMNNATVKPLWQVAASEGIVIRKIQSLLFVVTLAALIAAAMGIASLMTNAILQRAKEIGLMKSLGAKNWQVYLLFYAESVICGLIGGLLGCLAGWGLAAIMGYALFGSPVGFHWIIVPLVLVISVMITVVGTYFPSRRIASLYPVEVLYGRQ